MLNPSTLHTVRIPPAQFEAIPDDWFLALSEWSRALTVTVDQATLDIKIQGDLEDPEHVEALTYWSQVPGAYTSTE